MTEAELNKAIAAGQVNFQTAPTPDFSNLSLEDLEKRLNDYVPLLESLRIRGGSMFARIYQSANQSIPTATDTLIEFDTETTSGGINVDLTNSKLIVPVEGYYLVTSQLHYVTPTSGKFYQISLAVNGSVSGYGSGRLIAAGTTPIAVTVTDLLHLDKGDTISVNTYHNTGSASSLVGGSAYTFLTIARI